MNFIVVIGTVDEGVAAVHFCETLEGALSLAEDEGGTVYVPLNQEIEV